MIKELRAGDPATVGPYRLLGRLGAGGMGQVYLAKSPGGRLVAIKLIRPELAEERGFRARFSSEISAARNVSGIYTAAVVDADPDAELPWMATVYVPGPSLTDAVDDNGPLPAKSVLALAAGLAEALQAIHRAGLVHRDLKPSNVLLAADGPRVIDFGISLALERSMMTATGMVMGSPGFMSPEQARGQREVGPPSDVFSLGTVLAFATTGISPFGIGPTPALLYRVVNEAPDLTSLPASLRPLIEQCLAKDPAERPAPAEVLAALSDDVDVLTGEWLPPAIAESMSRYSPTLQTPLPPALRETGAVESGPVRSGAAEPGPVSGGAEPGTAEPGSGEPAPAVRPAPGADRATPVPPGSALGAIGFEPTVLEPAVQATSAQAPGAAESVSATRVERGLLPDTSLVPAPGPFTAGRDAAGGSVPGATSELPPAGPPPSPRRRWRWPIAAAAAAIVVAVVALLLTSHSPGASPRVGPTGTASFAEDATQPPPSPAATASKPAAATSPATGFAPATQAPAARATGTPTSSPTATWTPTPTTAPTPTSSASPTTAPTPTPTPTAPTSAPPSPTTAPSPQAPTAAASPAASSALP